VDVSAAVMSVSRVVLCGLLTSEMWCGPVVYLPMHARAGANGVCNSISIVTLYLDSAWYRSD